jgi:hypothetical protein
MNVKTFTKQCRKSGCNTLLLMIQTPSEGWMPCRAEVTIRHGSDPPRAGKYCDPKTGETFDAEDVPCKTPVHFVHWSECEGADEFRRKR